MNVTETYGPCDCCGGECGDCIGCSYCLAVANCNGITDSDYDLFYNGTLLAHLPELDVRQDCGVTQCRVYLLIGGGANNLECDNLCYFGSDPELPLPVCPPPFDPRLICCGGGPPVIVTKIDIGFTLINVTADPMVFRLVRTVDNGCGDFGTFHIFRLGCDVPCCEVFREEYGEDTTFTYMNPCADEITPMAPRKPVARARRPCNCGQAEQTRKNLRRAR